MDGAVIVDAEEEGEREAPSLSFCQLRFVVFSRFRRFVISFRHFVYFIPPFCRFVISFRRFVYFIPPFCRFVE